jgi:signal transduction histidine kinase
MLAGYAYRWVVVLTACLAVVFALSGWSVAAPGAAALPGQLVLIGANTLPLLAVRRNPLAVVVVFAVAYPTWVALGQPTHELQSLPTLAAMYALGAWERPPWLRALGLLSPVWMVGAAAAGLWDTDWLQLSFVGLVLVVVWALGVVVAGRRAYARELEARTAELEHARQELADRAVADERARIARELHDVIAHAMSVITVHAGVGGHLLERRPAQAAEALAVIERTGREALAEMRRMLTMLRDPATGLDGDLDARGPLPEPQPGLADLPQLVQRVRDAGVRLSYTTRGASRGLPAGLELTAYRVAQEALTNAVKHAPGSRGSVTVSYLPDALEVEVANGAPAVPSHRSSTTGQGLRGMAERVALYGGQLETVADDPGFRVQARFPLEEAT